MRAFLRRQGKSLITAAALFTLVTSAASAAGIDDTNKPSAGAMAADLAIARPLLLVTTVAGAAVYLVSLPFSLAGGNAEDAGDTLVVGPARNTFVRCLGCKNPGYVGEIKEENTEE